jgi:biopolymer transport protein ExbB
MFRFLVRSGTVRPPGRFRYAPMRMALPAILLCVGIFYAVRVMAQVNSGTGAAAAPPNPSASISDTGPARPQQDVFSLILHNIDPVSITIGILSVCGLTLILQGFMRARTNVLMPPSSTNAIRELVSQKKFKELIDFTETDPSFVSKVLNPALKRAPSFSSMKEAMETAIGENTAEEFRRIEYLNIIGNLGPLLGLLGTVLGMIDAFQAMQASGGNANPAQLADGVSKALCHTFLGLMLAIPCLAAFGVLRTLVDKLTVRGALVAEELLLMIKPTDPARAGPGGPAGLGGASGPGSRAGAMPQPGFRKPPPMPPMPSPEPSPVPIT